MRIVAAAVLALILTACGSNSALLKRPQTAAQMAKNDAIAQAKCAPVIVTKAVERPLKMKKEDILNLTAACANSSAREQTTQEAKRLALFRNDSLIECSKRMAKIETIFLGLIEDAK